MIESVRSLSWWMHCSCAGPCLGSILASFFLVPTLPRGTAHSDALRPLETLGRANTRCLDDAERPSTKSHAGAWERGKS